MSLQTVIRVCVASLVFATGTAGPALAQTLGQGEPQPIAWWRIAAALLLCLLLAGAAAVALHLRMTGRLPGLRSGKLALPSLRGAPIAKLFGQPADRRLRSIETIRVSPYADVCLFTCDGKSYLVAATPQGVTVIERTEDAALEDPET